MERHKPVAHTKFISIGPSLFFSVASLSTLAISIVEAECVSFVNHEPKRSQADSYACKVVVRPVMRVHVVISHVRMSGFFFTTLIAERILGCWVECKDVILLTAIGRLFGMPGKGIFSHEAAAVLALDYAFEWRLSVSSAQLTCCSSYVWVGVITFYDCLNEFMQK